VPQLTVIIVNWNVRELLRACLRSVLSQLGEAGEVVVVDNASGDGSADMLRAEFPQVRLMANAQNVGFGAANNQALVESDAPFVLFLNPDTEVRPEAIGRLLAFMQDRPRVACAGPRLLNPDGSTQSSRRAFPGVATAFVESTILQRWFGGLKALARFYRAAQADNQPQPVDWLVGACLLMRRSALDQVGFFDERFFMYSEEMDLCYRLRQAGWEVWYVPAAEVVHHEAASSSQDLFRRNVNFHESRYRFFRKHHGAAPALALRWFVFGTFLFQMAEEGAKFVLQPAKRPMRRARIQLFGKLVRWYLS
jgi:N-acetylglucosaminyl-diphospho-decaprenol L-rhamnosyltransferase